MGNGTILRLATLFLCIFMGCGVAHGNSSAPTAFHTLKANQCLPVSMEGMVKKIDNFMVIFDPSASMTETYLASEACSHCHTAYVAAGSTATQHALKHGGQEFAKKDAKINTSRCSECHQGYLYNKFKFAKNLINCFNQTIPDLDLVAAIRLLGSPFYTNRSYGLASYDKGEFAHEIRKILDADGASPLDLALEEAGRDWFNSTGKIAIIVVSDGKDMDDKAVMAAGDLKERYNDRLCLYTVLIGQDRNGAEVMGEIAKAGTCGEMVNGDSLLNEEAMAAFTTEIFLTREEPSPVIPEEIPEPVVADSDGDGVLDDRDDCPDTQKGLEVDEHGCWKLIMATDVLFDFDKYVFKPEGITALNQVYEFMSKYPFLDLAISGHTDNHGSMDYNIGLSERRAMAGFDYLTARGIARDRLSVSWHSFSIPRATNETAEGRALNRRLEFTFSKR